MNKGSKNVGFMYLCASRKVGLPPINQLLGEKASIGCSSGFEAVEGTDKRAGKPFNFDPAGVGVVLCASRPPAPLTTLALAVGLNSTTDTCPPGTKRISEGAGWDGDFNAGASGAYAYLCSGSNSADSQPPITSLRAVVASAPGSATGPELATTTSCPAGYEQLEGNMNQGSKNKRTVHLCVSRQSKSTAVNNTAGAIVGLVGETASTGCTLGFEAVPGDDGQPFNFDPAGQGIVLCLHRAGGRSSCPSPPPAQPQHAIAALTTIISPVAGACCPEGFEPVGPAGGASSMAEQWDGDLNSDAGGNFVYLCTSKGGGGGGGVSLGNFGGADEYISQLVAFTTPSAADPFEPCPSGFRKLGNSTSGNLNSASKNSGAMYLCYKTAPRSSSSLSRLVGVVVGNTSSNTGIAVAAPRVVGAAAGGAGEAGGCPSGMRAVEGTAAQPGPFDFDPPAGGGVGLHLCYSTLGA